MIPSDGGGGGYTAWEAYDIEAIHNMVQSVTDDQIQTSWDQVTAWRKTQELLDSHAGTLMYYRQSLVGHWPPEKSAASTAFVRYVDELIQSLQNASKAANDNVRALADLTSGVSTARTEVKKAYQEYAANQTKVSPASPTPTPTGRPMPTPSPAPPPVAPGRQEQLIQQARKAMATLSGTAVDSTSRMTVPPPYTPPGKPSDYASFEHIDAPSVVTAQPPVVPAPRTSASQFNPTTPYVPGATGSGSLPSGPDLGTLPGGSAPILTGGVVTPPSALVTPTPPALTPNAPGSLLPPGGIVGFPPGLDPVGGGKSASGGSTNGLFGGGAGYRPTDAVPGVPAEGHAAGGARPLAPGGVIGGSPGMGAANPVASGERGGAGAASRVNPVGGVLAQSGPSGGHGGGPAGTRGAAGSTTTGQPFLAGQRAGKGDRGHESRTWDPDDPWAVEHGVAPVLEPVQERSTHDPGPGVIGIDR